MGEYFIRLDKLVGLDFLAKVPLLGALVRNAGVRRWREVWNDEASVVEAEAVIDHPFGFEVGGFGFMLGDVAGGQTSFRIEIASDRSSLATTIADRAEEMAGVTDPPPRDGLQILARADGPPAASLIQIHDLALRVRLPISWARKAEIVSPGVIRPVGDADHPEPVEIVFGAGTVFIEPDNPDRPVWFRLDSDEALHTDPIFIDKLGIGLELIKLKLDFDREGGIPEVLTRPGYQESWIGLYVETFRVYGLNKIFPTLPDHIDPNAPADLIIEMSKWVIGFEDGGLSGSLKVTMKPPPSDKRALRGASFTLEMDRGQLVRAEHELSFHVDKIGGDQFSLGPEGELQITASLRFNPDDLVVIDLALRTPGVEDRGLVTLGPDLALGIQGAIAAWVLIDEIKNGEEDNAILLGALFYVLLQLQLGHALGFRRLTLDALQLRYREEMVAGRTLKWLDFIADIELTIDLDLKLSSLFVIGAALPDIKTDPDHPIRLLLKGLRVSHAFNFDDFTAAQLGGRKKLDFEMPNEYFFDFSDQALLQGSPIILSKFGFGRWDKGSWIDLGLKLAVNQPSATYSVLPAVMRLYFLADGSLDHVTFEGLSFSVLVPGVLFLRGRLNLGDTITEAALQGYFVSSPGLSLEAYNKPENWNWDIGAQYRRMDLEGGGESSIVFAWLRAAHGVPIPFLPGASLYGGHFLYASNARPALGGDPIDVWFTDHEPKNQIVIDKWEADQDATGFGLGLVIGSTADRGKPWNLQAGVLYADSQLLLNGYLNLFKSAPDVADTSAGALRFLGSWSSNRLLGSVRWTELMPADGKVLKLDLGVELLVDDAANQSHVYAGFHWPPERHLKALLFERYEVSFYLMADSADVENFAGTGVTLPGFVVAMGARFSIEGGRKKGHLKLYFYLRASADVAIAGTSPMITVVRAAVAGGLVAKAYGVGFEFEVEASFLWVRPMPSLLDGKIKITLDLPWPLPNIHYTLDTSDGEDGDTEALVDFIEGLSLLPRTPSGALKLNGGPNQGLVPLDPTFVIAFSYPTRNDTVDGNFLITSLGLDAVDTQVWHETSGGLGYAVTLKALRLWRGGVGQTLHQGPVPAKWVKQDVDAAGGQPSRRILELFSLEDVAVARLIGGAETWVEGLAEGWTPCAPPGGAPDSICYFWNAAPVGAIESPATVQHPPDPPLRVRPLAEPEGAESARRYFGWTAQLLEVVEFTVTRVFTDVDRALRLAAVEGGHLPDEMACASTELTFERASTVLLQIVRPGRGRQVVVRYYLGAQLVREDAEGVVAPGLEGRWEHVLYICAGPIDRVVIECAVEGQADVDDAAVYLLRCCLTYEKAQRDHEDAVASAGLWDQFWSTNAPADPMILEPDTHYALHVEGDWVRIKDGAELPGGAWNKVFEFDTVGSADWPRQLRGHDQSLDGRSNYDVKTTPPPGATTYYAGRPLRLMFRNRRVEALYQAFDLKLAIRIADDQGAADIRWIACDLEAADDLPGSEQAWQSVVSGAACTPADVLRFWYFPVLRLESVLAPGRAYDISVYGLPTSSADPDMPAYGEVAPLYQFTFHTARWPSLVDHLAAYLTDEPIDEMADAAGGLGTAAGLVGSAERVLDDVVLAAAIAALGLPPRNVASEPELSRLWRSGVNGPELVGLLLDGPEPLPRPEGGRLSVRTAADTPVPIAIVQGRTGSRTLILFREGTTTLGAIAPVNLRVVVEDDWIAADGAAQVDRAVLDLAIPPRPARLEPEAPP